MISPEPLEQLVEQDTFAEMLALLEPEDLAIAALRLEGLSDSQIAALLHVDPRTVGWRMEKAQLRIMEVLPELAPFLRGRRRLSPPPLSGQSPPLERGWLCDWGGGADEPLPELRRLD
jgi:hypothetical protein